MGTKTTGKYCNTCGAHVMAQKNTPNHLLHFVLSLFTFGLWLPVWLIITVAGLGGWRCTRCGHTV